MAILISLPVFFSPLSRWMRSIRGAFQKELGYLKKLVPCKVLRRKRNLARPMSLARLKPENWLQPLQH